MRPAARLEAAIQLLDAIIFAARDNGSAADHLASAFFKTRRYAGSKDRRAIRELVWNAIRRFGERPDTGRSAMVAMADSDNELAACFDGSHYGPAIITADEPRAKEGLIPEWIDASLPAIIDQQEKQALLDRAPLDLRVNMSRTNRANVLAQLEEATPIGDNGIRLPTNSAITQLPLYRNGLIEIQDFGSQLIVQACGDVKDTKILDLCAGAGGKTLSLFDKILKKQSGEIVATDVNRARLSKIAERQARLMQVAPQDKSLDMIRKILLNPGKEIDMLSEFSNSFDIVLVDAPCSGSGTWRRNPETRWRLTTERLEQVKRQQARVLNIAAEMTKKGGTILYAVCSIFEEEGSHQVKTFLSHHKNWQVDNIDVDFGRAFGDGIMLTPNHDGCDGFFYARLKKL